MANPWDKLTETIIDTVSAGAKKFLEENSAAKDFLADRAKALAKAIYELKMASDADKPAAQREINIIQQTIENKLVSVALQGQHESNKMFRAIFMTAFNAAVKLAPILI